jgi:pyridoxamine 5'-phosphate oxidase
MNNSVAALRREYATESLLEADIAPEPIHQFSKWWEQVIRSEIVEPNAMTLATASSDGMPSARIVLLKGFDAHGFVFFTNYKSYKGIQLEENPRASLVFFWKELERQVRVIGLVRKVDDRESDEYFHARPHGSQLGAWASPQSTVIESREWLDSEYAKLKSSYSDKEVKRPPHWGGYRVQPVIMEFWQGRPSRLHDRIQYSLQNDGSWLIERLAP